MNELSGDIPFSYLGLKHFSDLAEAALAPSPRQLVRDVDPDLRPYFEQLYARPELTDPVWLTMFRIVSSRMGRDKHCVPMIMYCPIDTALIAEIAPRRLCLAEILMLAGQVAEPFPVLGYNPSHLFPALTDQPGGFGCTADTMVAAVALTALPSFLRVAK